MNVAYLCLGGNLGRREENLKAAVLQINEQAGKIIRVSKVYETEAWGVSDQPPYLNLCLQLETKLSAFELMKVCLDIEKKSGRRRVESNQYAPRTLDIDILFYNTETITTNDLRIPHPRLHLRKFVLLPLNDIAPDFVHPDLKKTVSQMLNVLSDPLSVNLYPAEVCISA